jgi:glycosyltransferase involved in cell wall biosynthesis
MLRTTFPPRMRILIVSQYFWPESFRVNDLAVGLSERGHDVTVLTGEPNYESGSFADGYSAFSPRSERYHNVDVERFPLISRGSETGFRLAANYLSFALTASLFAPVRLRRPIDVVLVYQMSPVTMAAPAFVLKALRGLPLILWVQDLWPDALRATGKVKSERALDAMRKIVAAMYRASDRVLVQSEAFVPDVCVAGVRANRIGYLPNWAEAVYQPCTVEREAGERRELPDGFRVMVAGNIGVAQSMGTVVDAAHRLADVQDLRWIVVGDGRRRRWTENRVASLGLGSRFSFVDRRPVDVMPRYLSLADVLLVTLARDPAYALTVPSRLQSYLACARPVIASLDGEGARVVEESGAGLVCASEDSSALADRVLTMYRMRREEREAMGKRGRAYFERHFERETLLDRLEGWFEEVLTSRRRRRT